MTTGALAPNYFALDKSAPMSRFFKSLKRPEWAMLAGKFVAALITGGLTGAITAHDVPLLWIYSLKEIPPLIDKGIDKIFENDLRNDPDRFSPEKFSKWSTIATFSGSTIGYACSLLLNMNHSTDHFNRNFRLPAGICLSVFSAFLHSKNKKPPSGLSLS